MCSSSTLFMLWERYGVNMKSIMEKVSAVQNTANLVIYCLHCFADKIEAITIDYIRSFFVNHMILPLEMKSEDKECVSSCKYVLS